MEGRSSQTEQPAGIRRGGKIQKLTAVDIGKQYLDSFKEIGNEWRSWVRISVTVLIEQKIHRLQYIYIHTYIYIYICKSVPVTGPVWPRGWVVV